MDNTFFYLTGFLALACLLVVYYFITQNTFFITKKALRKLPDSFLVINDVKLDNSLELDHIVIGKPGIFLIKIIDKKGIITGDESQTIWLENVKEKAEEFDNPTLNNIKNIGIVRDMIKDINDQVPIFPIVVFHSKADLSDLFSESLTIRANTISNYINRGTDVLDEDQIKDIYKRLDS